MSRSATVLQLAIATGELIIATDGHEAIEPQRRAAFDALSALRDEWQAADDRTSASDIPLTRRRT